MVLCITRSNRIATAFLNNLCNKKANLAVGFFTLLRIAAKQLITQLLQPLPLLLDGLQVQHMP
jgi:hypothetical protein